LFPKAYLNDLKIPRALFSKEGVEYWDQIGFLKAGVVYSDAITTVSPSYAGEIQTDELGMGLGGLLKSLDFKMSGILNGIDTDVWNPATDPAIAAPFGVGKMAGKKLNKKALQNRFGLAEDNKAPLFCVVSRLTEQKGLDLVAGAIPHIIGNGGQLMVLGSGDKNLESTFKKAAADHPEQVATYIGYDEELAHLVQAGADAIFIPSRFEPCGLTQLCAMRYGTLPIVARVGGLADTVIDANAAALQLGVATGLQFSPVKFDAFCQAVNRFFDLYADQKAFAKLQRCAMKLDVSWKNPSASYQNLYYRLSEGS
jgi:starch synthase